ncbi:TPA: hypothetical protein ACSPZW_003679, partial [Aeromonas hydrophila]
EVSQAVIKSLESIKDDTEKLRVNLNSKYVQHLVLDLVHTLSKELIFCINTKTIIMKYYFIKYCR